MFLTRTVYDRSVNTFSPEGRLFQAEYAIEAIKLGSTAIGLKSKEGVVLAVEKRITSPLLEPSRVEKIMEIDEHIGCAMSGLIADARTLVEHARVETQNHRFSYGEPMTVESTTQALCDLALRFGEGEEESMSRPFGVSLLIAGHDENGPSLFYMDPSGTFWQCNGNAIGSGSEGADSSLQEQYNKELTLKEAETIALSIWRQVMEEKVTPINVDIAMVAPTYHLYTPTEVEAVVTMVKNKTITSFFKRTNEEQQVEGIDDEIQESKRQKGSTSEPVISPVACNEQPSEIPHANINEVDVSSLERDPAK
ncbi:proteasome subunit alpha type-5 [Artemisia annua]|uniref:Proteasome subunit alpha type-5 n=1 Tax=Artemisia annua TaxID=35608 RepID=A0A2U1QAK9_ARTAN|nr:proteasome subunit alpha type-5 [Artemisia annua]